MRNLSENAKKLLIQLLEWDKSGEPLAENICSIIDSEGEDSPTLESAKELEIMSFISWLWADNKPYWVGINDKAR